MIMMIGEAWGIEEERAKLAFVGPTGRELARMSHQAGIQFGMTYRTNVFNLRPRPSNDISNLCGPKESGIPGRPPLKAGKYVRAEFAGELDRLFSEVRATKPALVVAVGGTASWALLGDSRISKIRGAVAPSSLGPKVLPVYHPSAVVRDWSLRHVTVLDLMKARREAEFPEIRRPHREIWIEPTLTDLEDFHAQHIQPCSILAFDIETSGPQITCIGFAPNERVALVIPFTDSRRANGSYWPSHSDERAAWLFVARVLSSVVPKLAQNGLYDIHFLWRQYGIAVRNFTDDTMLLHHALQPESPKGLDFLGSVYTNEAAWKLMRRGPKGLKKDE